MCVFPEYYDESIFNLEFIWSSSFSIANFFVIILSRKILLNTLQFLAIQKFQYVNFANSILKHTKTNKKKGVIVLVSKFQEFLRPASISGHC